MYHNGSISFIWWVISYLKKQIIGDGKYKQILIFNSLLCYSFAKFFLEHHEILESIPSRKP
jgi:hypothetical protein